ncbi:hypothetical protein CLAFUW4_20107 [Fulvia fulva]|uniref:uncharacterized protein n=1 Tax=Passalora fulva TaxID=5499 RepID=UPI0028527EE4|nr:uncharacterized protein CLAFUR5_20107 [Fulvia fulva]KAK4610149.1 hypothetical protein CLAFUR4_20107 [Fulvia fulva]KAK4611188.1 hypothetical protein CLAFUR0_20107 [Fulvia fulva]WMI39085.1 hypothetical protein CLAFUR5_20107 [Fulvia fulva]WPV22355.1 hypothetical protein CLAFUW4_20107 [Fulvia fulva]WPV36690.1 hypothetical protein CLAFUW7_20107 [Fulvia fulva]
MLLTAILTLLCAIWTAMPQAAAQRQCYNPDGSLVTDQVYACRAGDSESHCCPRGMMCTTNSLCKAPEDANNTQYWRASCTDPTWNSSACPKYCTNGTNDSHRLIELKPSHVDMLVFNFLLYRLNKRPQPRKQPSRLLCQPISNIHCWLCRVPRRSLSPDSTADEFLLRMEMQPHDDYDDHIPLHISSDFDGEIFKSFKSDRR